MKSDNVRYDLLLACALACMLAIILVALVDSIVPAGANETPKWAGGLESSFQIFHKTPCATEQSK